jgi:hypothetical protein
MDRAQFGELSNPSHEIRTVADHESARPQLASWAKTPSTHDTPQGPQPLARAIVTTHLQQLRNELALP